MNAEIDDYREARGEVEKRWEKRGFLIHLVIYIIFNAVVFPVINFVYSPEDLWFYYPLIIWGIGIFGVHLPLGVLLFDKWWNRQEEQIKEILEKKR